MFKTMKILGGGLAMGKYFKGLDSPWRGIIDCLQIMSAVFGGV